MALQVPIKNGAASFAFAVTPSDSANLSADAANTKGFPAMALMCAATGNLSAITADGQTITITGAAAGLVVGGATPILFSRVRASGTTGTWVAFAPIM